VLGGLGGVLQGANFDTRHESSLVFVGNEHVDVFEQFGCEMLGWRRIQHHARPGPAGQLSRSHDGIDGSLQGHDYQVDLPYLREGCGNVGGGQREVGARSDRDAVAPLGVHFDQRNPGGCLGVYTHETSVDAF